jgi:hypothetical protein
VRSPTGWLAAGAVGLAATVLAGQAGRGASPAGGFVDVTVSAGIAFRHTNGAFGRKLLPETMGSGVTFVDVDGDGRQDLFFVNGTKWPGQPGRAGRPALYRNQGDGTFADVTKQAGLAVELYGMGVAAGDYDNDGDADLYVTALGPNRLFRNRGDGRFEDVSVRARVADPGFSTSAAWLDYDRDGRLDLFVANYVEWSLEKDLFCTLDGKTKSYCTPESYKGQSPSLYRNEGDGTFENVTRAAGLFDPASKALGVALIDYNNDGWLDLAVANDTQPNRLYENRRNGTFADVGTMAGIAFNEAGVARAGMGIDAGDYDGSGRQSLVIGNFSNEMMALYTNEGNGLFIDEAPAATIGRASLLTLTFACFFFDHDLDGLLDIFAANGHVADDISRVQPKVTYAQPPHLFRNAGSRRMEVVSAQMGADFQRPMVARGAAYGDYDDDGDLDLAISTSNGPARLLANRASAANHRLRMRLRGISSNRDAIGAEIRLTLADGARRWGMVRSGSSYLSQSELPVTIGLGGGTGIASLDVRWPNGRTERVPGALADEAIVIEEGKGIVERTAIVR